MLIYILLFVCIALCGRKINNKKYNVYDFIVIISLILVSGLRNAVGTDYEMYKLFYFNPNHPNAGKMEIGFKLLMNLSSKIFGDYYFLFFILCAALTIIPIYYIIKKYSNKPTESVLFFLALGFYTFTFNVVRQGIAIAIAMVGIKFILEKKPVKYIITILLASTFHITALIMLPAYFIANVKVTKRQSYIISGILLLSGFLVDPIMKYGSSLIPQYAMYANYNGDTVAGIGTYVNSLIYLIIVFLVIYLRKENEEEDPRKTNFFNNLSVLSVAFISLSIKNTLFARLIYYIFFELILIMPNLIKALKIKNKTEIKFVLLIILFAYYIANVYFFGDVYPYRSIFR